MGQEYAIIVMASAVSIDGFTIVNNGWIAQVAMVEGVAEFAMEEGIYINGVIVSLI